MKRATIAEAVKGAVWVTGDENTRQPYTAITKVIMPVAVVAEVVTVAGTMTKK